MMGLTDWVMKLISPKITFEPYSGRPPRRSRGRAAGYQEVVVSSSRTMMSGTSTSAAPTTSLTTSFCTLAVLAALPDMAPPSPMSS
ncbi:MAG: hypothetical protein ACLUEK_16890 [Oscillospiraceae bacterium]